MTVTSVVPYKKYACTGTTEYAYTFRIDDDSDIEVKRIDTAGAETTLTITSDYTVADNGDGTGGTVTTVSTYSDGYLQLRRDMEAVQETEFSDGGPLPAERLEEGLDRVVMLIQQVTSDVDLGALVDAAAASTAAAASAAAALVSEGNASDSEDAAAASAASMEGYDKVIVGGDITVSGNVLTFTAYSCIDSTGLVLLEAAAGETVTIPTVANTIYNLFAVKLVADSSHEIRAYAHVSGTAASVAPSADSAVSAFRRFDYWLTDGSAVCLDGYSIAGEHYNTKASEAAVNAFTTTSNDCDTELDLAAFIPDDGFVSRVLLGAQSTGARAYVVYGFDGTNTFNVVQHNSTYDADNQAFAWGTPGTKWMPFKTGVKIYWGRGGYTGSSARTLLQATRLRR